MSGEKFRELHLVGNNNLEGPILSVVESKEMAEEVISMIRRSNRPAYLHVIEKSAYDSLQAKCERLQEAADQALRQWLGYIEDHGQDDIDNLDHLEANEYRRCKALADSEEG